MKSETKPMTLERAIEILGQYISAPFWTNEEKIRAEKLATEVLLWVLNEFGEDYQDGYANLIYEMGGDI